MKSILSIAGAAAVIFAGCSSAPVADKNKDTLNEPSERVAHLEDHLPPNPNRAPDNRDLKSIPVAVQHDPALNEPSDQHEGKGLSVNAGPDQHVRPQDPTISDTATNAVGGPAAQAQTATASKADNDLTFRVKEALMKKSDPGANIDTAKSEETNGEAKAIQNLGITVKAGQVSLSGSVPTETDRTAYEQAAMRVPGVTSVNNYLAVSKTEKQ